MLAFLLRRLGQSALVLLTVAALSFALFQYVGDPVAFLVGQDASPEKVAEVRAELGLDQPMPVQFARFVGHALQGDFGTSLRLGKPVSSVIATALPATLELALLAALVALLVGIPLGVYTALRRGSPLAQALMAFSLVGVSLPNFLIGIVLILVFAVQLGWVPSFGRGEVVMLGGWSTGLATADEPMKHLVPLVLHEFAAGCRSDQSHHDAQVIERVIGFLEQVHTAVKPAGIGPVIGIGNFRADVGRRKNTVTEKIAVPGDQFISADGIDKTGQPRIVRCRDP